MSESLPVGPDSAAAPRPDSPRARRRLASVQEQRDLRRRLVAWSLSIGLVVLLVNSVVGENGYLATLRAQQEVAGLRTSVSHLRIANQRLQDEIARLRTDPEALEEAARRSLGLMRPGETMVVIRDVTPEAHAPVPK